MMNREELMKRIEKEFDYYLEKTGDYEILEAEIELTDEEVEIFLSIEEYTSDNGYYWEIEDNILYITISEMD